MRLRKYFNISSKLLSTALIVTNYTSTYKINFQCKLLVQVHVKQIPQNPRSIKMQHPHYKLQVYVVQSIGKKANAKQ